MKNHWKTTSFILAGVLTLQAGSALLSGQEAPRPGLAPAFAPGGPAPRLAAVRPQRQMQAALRDLNSALAALDRASHNKGGYRVSAVQKIHSAIADVHQGMQFAAVRAPLGPGPQAGPGARAGRGPRGGGGPQAGSGPQRGSGRRGGPRFGPGPQGAPGPQGGFAPQVAPGEMEGSTPVPSDPQARPPQGFGPQAGPGPQGGPDGRVGRGPRGGGGFGGQGPQGQGPQFGPPPQGGPQAGPGPRGGFGGRAGRGPRGGGGPGGGFQGAPGPVNPNGGEPQAAPPNAISV